MKTRASRLLAAMLFVSFALFCSDRAWAVAYTWNGETSTSWSDSSNWTPIGVPGTSPTDTATFPAGSNNLTVLLPEVISETLQSIDTQAPYVFQLDGQLTLTGQGIVNDVPSNFVVAPSGALTFTNGAISANSMIQNQGSVAFHSNSSSSLSVIINSGQLDYFDNSFLGGVTIDNREDGLLTMSGTVNAQFASIQNDGTANLSGLATPIPIGALFGDPGTPGDTFISSIVTIGYLNTNMVLPNIILGTGSLTKVGTGTLHLSADSNYFGNTEVQSGTLDVTGSISGPILIAPIATLTGSGGVGLTDNLGILSPTGMLTINGPLIEQPTAQTNLSVSATGPGDTLSVTATATLNGSLRLGFSGGPLPPGTVYVLIDSSSLSGTFSSCTADALPPGQLSYSATQLTFTTPAAEEIFENGFEAPACD